MVTCDIKLVTGHNQFLKVLLCVNPALPLGIVHPRYRKQLVMYVYEQCLCKKSFQVRTQDQPGTVVHGVTQRLDMDGYGLLQELGADC
jgi:hypothetical protein